MCTANWAWAAPELRLDILCRRLEIFGMPCPHGLDQLLLGQPSKRVSRAGVRKHRKGPQHHSQAPDLKIQDPHVLKAKAHAPRIPLDGSISGALAPRAPCGSEFHVHREPPRAPRAPCGSDWHRHREPHGRTWTRRIRGGLDAAWTTPAFPRTPLQHLCLLGA